MARARSLDTAEQGDDIRRRNVIAQVPASVGGARQDSEEPLCKQD